MSVRIPSARLSVPSGILKMTHQRQHLRDRRAYLSEGGPIYRLKMRRMDHTKFGVIFLVQLIFGSAYCLPHVFEAPIVIARNQGRRVFIITRSYCVAGKQRRLGGVVYIRSISTVLY